MYVKVFFRKEREDILRGKPCGCKLMKETRKGLRPVWTAVMDGLKSFGEWLKTVDEAEILTVPEAVKAVNKINGAGTIDDNVVEAMGIATELNKKEADGIFDRTDAVGPVFSAAEGDKGTEVEDPTVALNRALEDETMKYVNGNPVELQPVDPAKLEKGGKERERIK